MLKKVWIALAGIVAVCSLLIGYAVYQATKDPANNADAALKAGIGHGKNIVVCLGDSITHGAVSSDYVRMLSDDPELTDFMFVNEGINSRLAFNLLQIVDRVAALKPRYVFILIGTNDLIATFSDEKFDYYNDLWDLPQKPTRQWFAANYRKLVRILKAGTDATIVMISIPPVGEDIGIAPFRQSVDYSKLIREMALEMRVSYIPFNEILTDALLRSGKKVMPPYRDDHRLMYAAIAKHYLMCRDWDAVSDDLGLKFLTDNIHLNGRAGRILAEKIKESLKPTIMDYRRPRR